VSNSSICASWDLGSRQRYSRLYLQSRTTMLTRRPSDLGPKVYLSATDKKALDVVSMSDLKRYATHEK